MSWYYAQDGQQVGPVTDEEFARLAQAGTIQAETLVWRAGMPDWQPYARATAAPTTPIPQPPVVQPTGMQTCSRCGNAFSTQDLIQYGDARICPNCKPLFFQELRERGQPAAAFEYGGFWIRVGAKMIDGLILGVPLLVAFLLFLLTVGLEFNRHPRQAMVFQLLAQVGFYGMSALYSIFFVGRYGATPGKMVVGLRIVLPDGGPVSYGRAAGRFFSELISGLICYIGYLMVAFDKERRGLHDLICNTRVIKKPR